MGSIKPPRIIIISYLIGIVLGTVLLSLPIATSEGAGVSLIDKIFTATSAICVTGLTVTGPSSWTGFGQFVILGLIQLGGLGIMTFSTLFAIFLGKKITIRENLVITGTMGRLGVTNLKALVLYIFLVTFLFEFVGAALLFGHWRAIETWPLGTTVFNSAFHSISAFCNAGFSPFTRNLLDYRDDMVVNLVIMGLIFFGGIGFVVIVDLWNLRTRARDKRPVLYRMSIQTKTALSMSFALIILGAAAIFFLEQDNALSGLSTKTQILSSFFQSVTTRTAGYNTLPIGNLAAATLTFMIFLMFIGASPGSTGGGIKTSTFNVVLASVLSMIKNKERVWVFKKTMPKTVVRKAIAVFVLAIGWIFFFSLLLTFTERSRMLGDNSYLKIVFEVTSAFGTVGLSAGITPLLSDIGKLLLSATMFLGKIGPLTLALAVALQEEKLLYNYPEEEVMVG